MICGIRFLYATFILTVLSYHIQYPELRHSYFYDDRTVKKQ